MWEKGRAIDLGNLGGDGAGAGNHACSLNNRGQVVGHSNLSDDVTFHGFLWTREKRMQDLGTLDSDPASLGLGRAAPNTTKPAFDGGARDSLAPAQMTPIHAIKVLLAHATPKRLGGPQTRLNPRKPLPEAAAADAA